MSDPEGLRLTQAESVPVPAARTAPPLPPLGEGGASSAQSSGKLQLALEALCLSTSLCFCLCHCLSLSPSVFLYISLSLSPFPCLSTVSISLCKSLFLCLSVSLAHFIHPTPLWRPWLSHAARFIIIGSNLMDPPFFGCVPLKV